MPNTPIPQPGDIVLINDGPFMQHTGPVIAVDEERSRIQLVVQVFGDDTRIDVPLGSVEKAADS